MRTLKQVAGRDWITFHLVSELPITEAVARQVQEPDYPAWGYGFYNFQAWKRDNKYFAMWRCSASCE